MVGSPARKPASTTPTAMPSGRLWIASAASIIVGFFSVEAGPSGSSDPTCRWGVKWSMAKSRNMPPRKPAPTGSHEGTAPPSAASSAGTMRLHTLAAIMTPAAKPKSALVKRSDMPWRAKSTSAAPSVFPRNGTTSATSTPATTGFSIVASFPTLLTALSALPRNKHSAPPPRRRHQPSCVVAP